MSTQAQSPPIEEFTIHDRDGTTMVVRGVQLGFASSQRDVHSHLTSFAGASDEQITAAADEYLARIVQLRGRGVEVSTDNIASLDAYVASLEDPDINPANLTRYAAPGERCSACRWFEVRIIRVEYEQTVVNNEPVWSAPRDAYLVVTHGASVVPGEMNKRRSQWTSSPYTVLEMLIQRRNGTPFLPATSARVLAEAAAVDAGIAGAYVNRAVA